jgi:recombination associated protein RdgC
MFKNAHIYRIEHWEPLAPADIESRLAGLPFVECAATQQESAGWVAPSGDAQGALAESVAGQWVFRLCTETKAVPGSVVKIQLESRLAAIEQQTGRRPRGKQVRELKEDLVHALLPRAFPKRADTVVWLDPQAGMAWIGAASSKRADAAVTRLVELMGGALKLNLLQTELSPATAMSQWLTEQEAPAGFSIDRDCELKQPDSEKSAVRYARHTLDIAEVGEHIRQGKLPTQLALTWEGRVSFVLTEALTLKKIQLLDGVLEGAGVDAANAGQDDGGFDADVAITTGELRRLLPALIDALGGLHERQAGAPSTAAGPSTASTESTPSGPASTAAPGSATKPAGAPWDPVPA